MALLRKSVSLTVIGWIDGSRVQAPAVPTDWYGKTLKGLVGTSNPPPPDSLGDIQAFLKQKQHRAAIHVNLALTVDSVAKSLHKVEVISKLLDEGWTPPMPAAMSAVGWVLPLGIPFAMSPAEASALRDRTFYRGEKAGSSYVSVNEELGKIQLCKQTEIESPTGETPVMRAMIKFRAGKHTDHIGHDVIKCPYHVPWTWAEVLLTYRKGELVVRANCATFPCFSFYLSGDVTNAGRKMDTLYLDGSQLRANIRVGKMGPDQIPDAGASLTKPMSEHEYAIKIGHMSKEMSRHLML